MRLNIIIVIRNNKQELLDIFVISYEIIFLFFILGKVRRASNELLSSPKHYSIMLNFSRLSDQSMNTCTYS